MKDNFDIKKFLTENKLTKASKILLEQEVDINVLDQLGYYESSEGYVISDLVKNSRHIEGTLTKAGIEFTKSFDEDVHGQKIVVFTVPLSNTNVTEIEKEGEDSFESVFDKLMLLSNPDDEIDALENIIEYANGILRSKL